MELIEILIGIGAISLVAFTIVFNIIRKSKGKSSCGCDCPSSKNGSCAGCSRLNEYKQQ